MPLTKPTELNYWTKLYPATLLLFGRPQDKAVDAGEGGEAGAVPEETGQRGVVLRARQLLNRRIPLEVRTIGIDGYCLIMCEAEGGIRATEYMRKEMAELQTLERTFEGYTRYIKRKGRILSFHVIELNTALSLGSLRLWTAHVMSPSS